MFAEYDVVRLVSDLPSKVLRAGTRGAILMIYPVVPAEYEVELVDDEGHTLAIQTVKEERLNWKNEPLSLWAHPLGQFMQMLSTGEYPSQSPGGLSVVGTKDHRSVPLTIHRS